MWLWEEKPETQPGIASSFLELKIETNKSLLLHITIKMRWDCVSGSVVTNRLIVQYGAAKVWYWSGRITCPNAIVSIWPNLGEKPVTAKHSRAVSVAESVSY
jgi:hypothetical protein